MVPIPFRQERDRTIRVCRFVRWTLWGSMDWIATVLWRTLGGWYYNDEFTPTGEMFDVGNTCSYAIWNVTL